MGPVRTSLQHSHQFPLQLPNKDNTLRWSGFPPKKFQVIAKSREEEKYSLGYSEEVGNREMKTLFFYPHHGHGGNRVRVLWVRMVTFLPHKNVFYSVVICVGFCLKNKGVLLLQIFQSLNSSE